MYKFLIKHFLARNTLNPTLITLTNGVVIDVENKRVILPSDFAVHTNGDLRLTSDKHVIIKSGQGAEKGRPGYRYSIWLNSDEDEAGRPIMQKPRIDDDGDDS